MGKKRSRGTTPRGRETGLGNAFSHGTWRLCIRENPRGRAKTGEGNCRLVSSHHAVAFAVAVALYPLMPTDHSSKPIERRMRRRRRRRRRRRSEREITTSNIVKELCRQPASQPAARRSITHLPFLFCFFCRHTLVAHALVE